MVARDWIQVEFAGVQWSIESRYKLRKSLGCGGQGVVVAADTGGEPVAIKKIDEIFESHQRDEAKRVLREIRLMRCLNHANVLALLDVMVPPAERKRYLLTELYLVTELVSTDLQRILSVANRPESQFELRPEQVQYLAYQMLCGVHYIGSAGVLHRDLKPANLLVDLTTCQLRICDFGLARGVEDDMDDDSNAMTEYVVTRAYRAPEVLLGENSYGLGVDVWSAGCILAEMLVPKMGVLFHATERRGMLMRITSLLGRPRDLSCVANPHARDFLASLPSTPEMRLRDHLQHANGTSLDVTALDLLDSLVKFDPAFRMSAADALRQPYLAWPRARVGAGADALERCAHRRVDMSDVEDPSLSHALIQRRILDEAARFRRASGGGFSWEG